MSFDMVISLIAGEAGLRNDPREPLGSGWGELAAPCAPEGLGHQDPLQPGALGGMALARFRCVLGGG